MVGNGSACSGTCGEGGLALNAQVYYPVGIASNSAGTFYLANNSNYVIDSFTVGGNLNLIAGNHSSVNETLITGAPANGVILYYPFQLAMTLPATFISPTAKTTWFGKT